MSTIFEETKELPDTIFIETKNFIFFRDQKFNFQSKTKKFLSFSNLGKLAFVPEQGALLSCSHQVRIPFQDRNTLSLETMDFVPRAEAILDVMSSEITQLEFPRVGEFIYEQDFSCSSENNPRDCLFIIHWILLKAK